MADEFEYLVRRRLARLNRTWDSSPTDKETALAIMGDVGEGIEQTLLRRRKASPWRKIAQPRPTVSEENRG